MVGVTLNVGVYAASGGRCARSPSNYTQPARLERYVEHDGAWVDD